MHPKHSRNRYALILVLSLLIHALIIAVLLWGVPEPEKKQKNSVEVQLKHIEREDKKKPLAKKAEAKKAQAKKAQAKKAEAKKAQAKKAEAKKAEAKKAEAKKAEAKKAEAKKAEAKKVEAKKVEAKKVEAKKVEAKKVEAKKVEAKKVEAKKAQAKKAEAKKAEAKKAQAKKAQAKKTEQKQPKTHKDVKQKGRTADEPKKRFGSMRMLDEIELKEAVVFSSGHSDKFRSREEQGQRYIKSLSVYEKQELNKHLLKQVGHLFETFEAPKKDGKKYVGKISIVLDENGNIKNIYFKKRSGHDELDRAAYKSILNAKKLEMPQDPILRKAMYLNPLTSFYSDKDMIP
jgi:hypothetical protein